MVLPDPGIQNHLVEDGTTAGTAEEGLASLSRSHGGDSAVTVTTEKGRIALVSSLWTEVTQQLLSLQRKGELPWFLPSGSLQSLANTSHWPNSSRSPRTREPGKCSFL